MSKERTESTESSISSNLLVLPRPLVTSSAPAASSDQPAKRKRSTLGENCPESSDPNSSDDSDSASESAKVQGTADSDPIPLVPSKRKGHVMVAVSNTAALLLGGETTHDPKEKGVQKCLNRDSFYQLNIKSKGSQGPDVKWRKVEVKKHKEKRSGHTVLYDEQKSRVLLVGGYYYYTCRQMKNPKKRRADKDKDWFKMTSISTFSVSTDGSDHASNWETSVS